MRGVIDNSACFAAESAASRNYVTADAASRIAPASGQTADGTGFFGKDGASFRDVLDAINPLNHIPIVSGMLEEGTGHKVSTASKMIGGALLGGPIGFVASIVDAIFEQATGKGAAEAAFAALTDSGPSETQVASAKTAEDPGFTHIAENTVTAAPVDEVEITSKELASVKPAAGTQVASINRDKALLDLYGASAPSAHNSYKKAQMLSYLRDVNTTHVL